MTGPGQSACGETLGASQLWLISNYKRTSAARSDIYAKLSMERRTAVALNHRDIVTGSVSTTITN